MIKVWGTSFSLIGDLVMSLPQLNYFKNKYHDVYIFFIIHKKIKTTDPKAKELRSYIEPLITLAKINSLHSRRLVIKKIPKKNIVRILFEEIAPIFSDRPGGYTRITKLGYRDNDRAPVSVIEFVESFETVAVENLSSEKSEK